MSLSTECTLRVGLNAIGLCEIKVGLEPGSVSLSARAPEVKRLQRSPY